jgi:tetratricopeptide (TPR) repeat protein
LWKEELPRDFRPRTLNNRGYAFEAISDYDSALLDYNLAIKLNPVYAEALANRGNVQRHYGHYDLALSDYDAALRNRHPHPAFVYAWQGQALENAGKRREAMDAYRRSLASDPNCELAKAALARLEDTQQMSNVLKGKKVARGPIKPFVVSATPGAAPVASDEAQLTSWTPPPAEQPAMKEPVALPANAVALRPTAFDEHPMAAAPAQPPVPVNSVPSAQATKPAVVAAVTKPVAAVEAWPPAMTHVPMGEGGSDVVFAIQLGSFKTPELAEAGWLKVLKKAGELLNGLSHAVEPVTMTDGTVYRLFGEALPDRTAALNLCRTLRDKGTPCIVVRH